VCVVCELVCWRNCMWVCEWWLVGDVYEYVKCIVWVCAARTYALSVHVVLEYDVCVCAVCVVCVVCELVW
jgi:hypothetical protein